MNEFTPKTPARNHFRSYPERFFMQTYYPKLVIIMGLMVLGGIYYIIKGIFKRLPPEENIEGEAVSREAAPALWSRIDALAEKVGTTPPDVPHAV